MLDTNLILQDKYIFNLVHLAQEEGWQPKGAIIVIYTNPFNTQRKQVGMILLSKRITAII